MYKFGIALHIVDAELLEMDKSYLPHVTGSHLTKMAYGRLFMSKIVPHDIDRLLYLDTDVCICGDIYDDFYMHSFSDRYAIACRDISIETFAKHELDRTGVQFYFNSGVITINMQKMIADGVD